MYVLIKNDIVNEYPLFIESWRLNNPNISLPLFPTTEQLNEQGIYFVTSVNAPSYDELRQELEELIPENINGEWTQIWRVNDLSQTQIAINEENAKRVIKQTAMRLLSETDWTQMPDVNLLNKDEFTQYRTQLRAIALNPPIQIDVWPTLPNEVW